jgi:hypothetical protein
MTKQLKAALLRASSFAAGFAALALFADHAMAETIADVATNTSQNYQAIADVISGGAYLGGAGFGVKAAMKLRDHHDNPQQVKLSAPITYGLVAGALLGLPTFLTVGGDSTLGTSGQQNSLSSGVLH